MRQFAIGETEVSVLEDGREASSPLASDKLLLSWDEVRGPGLREDFCSDLAPSSPLSCYLLQSLHGSVWSPRQSHTFTIYLFIKKINVILFYFVVHMSLVSRPLSWAATLLFYSMEQNSAWLRGTVSKGFLAFKSYRSGTNSQYDTGQLVSNLKTWFPYLWSGHVLHSHSFWGNWM